MIIKTKAKAKINLYLDVLGRRDDGFHNIKSIMHTVSLADTVEVDTDADRIFLTCDDPSLPLDSRNLAWRAAESFFVATKINGGAKIHIEKNIPASAGLAGGSSDAAATLRALNKAFGDPLSQSEICELGAAMGADIPFCITGGCALCTGRGELLQPLPTVSCPACVIAKGGEGVSTPSAYKKLDEMYGADIDRDYGRIDDALEAVKNNDIAKLCGASFNIFEAAVLPVHSLAKRIKDDMYSYGADFAMMSGSGPSVFGFFPDRATATAAADKIRTDNVSAVVCTLE